VLPRRRLRRRSPLHRPRQPYAALSLARYTDYYQTFTGSSTTPDATGSVKSPTTHAWITLGVRGAFVL
jgi:hypothetical protein